MGYYLSDIKKFKKFKIEKIFSFRYPILKIVTFKNIFSINYYLVVNIFIFENIFTFDNISSSI